MKCASTVACLESRFYLLSQKPSSGHSQIPQASAQTAFSTFRLTAFRSSPHKGVKSRTTILLLGLLHRDGKVEVPSFRHVIYAMQHIYLARAMHPKRQRSASTPNKPQPFFLITSQRNHYPSSAPEHPSHRTSSVPSQAEPAYSAPAPAPDLASASSS